MRLVTVRELRAKSAEVLDASTREDVVVTSNGRPVAVLVPIEDGDLERTLSSLRRARAQEAVTRMRAGAAERHLDDLDPAQIDAEVRSTRRERPAR